MTEQCHAEGCMQRATVRFLVRWTERHAHFNAWDACARHADPMRHALLSGAWSGGVEPVEFSQEQRSLLEVNNEYSV